MKTLLLATAASAALAFPALAQQYPTQPNASQNQMQPNAPAMPQIQPNDQPAQQTPQTQAGAQNNIDPSMLNRRQIRQVQNALDRNGFGAGRADGVWGPETQSALANFQKSKNMGAANGELDNQTLAALDLNPNQFGQGQGRTP